MATYKSTLLFGLVVIVLLTVGTFVFSAIENNSYEDCFGLSMQIITTVGYGNVPPKTAAGKIFCIFFTAIGIPANLILLQKIGQHMLHCQKLLITKIEMAMFKKEPLFLAEKCFLVCFVFVWVLIFGATGVQMHEDNWSFLDGVYCFVITFTTIGFGDIIPGQNKSAATVVIWAIFTFLGLCAVSNFLNTVIECVQSQKIRNLLRRRVGQDETQG